MNNERQKSCFRVLKWAGWLVVHYAFCIIYSPTMAQSVLKEGIWVKIGVVAGGVYKLDQPTLTRFNPAFATADPRLIKLYGNGGAVLPQPNAKSRPSDLIENAIQVTGETDGRFDAGDALIFYGQSPHVVQYDSLSQRFSHQLNPYSDTTFYFLTIGSSSGSSTPGRRIPSRVAGTLVTTPTVTTFSDYLFHEQDALKLPTVRSGREWLGEYLTNDTTTVIPFDVPGLVANAPIRVKSSAVAGATVLTQFRIKLNGQTIDTLSMPTITGYEYGYQGYALESDTLLAKPVSTTSPVQVSVTFHKNGLYSAQGYLNFLAIQVQRELRQYNQPTFVRRLTTGQCAVRQATASLRVWDISNPLAPVNQAYALSAAQEAGWTAVQTSDYLLFSDAQLLTPVSLKPVINQDLHSQASTNLLIVTPAAWQSEAERLAKFRREHDGLSVLVVTTQQVYNEFGSGQPDPTAIRDMARYYYQKQPGTLKYLLLFGDATYDYKNIAGFVNAGQLANMVPVYESRESLHPVLSYSSDDYYGFMDITEGEWSESAAGDYAMDIGVGRLPVKGVNEAQTVVDKLIRYSSDPTLAGDWQTRVMLVADDGDYNTHQNDANQLAISINKTAPAYRPERIFLDNYAQENTADGQKAPVVNKLIDKAIDDGRLIINYSGHGGVSGLADEQIVTLQDIFSWKNRRLPLFVTATCQFGRYDDPNQNSGAELALLSRAGGAISLLTTTRPVYANTNLLLNEAFYRSVFVPINGQMPRLGEVMQYTKNNSLSGAVNRNFALLGDPSLRLAYPQAQVALTQINGRNIATNRIDTLKALQTVELTGEIRQLGQRLSDFTGTLRLTLFDKATTQTTLGSEADSPKLSYSDYTSPVFTGQVPVQQGRFSVRFTMPKDIDYKVGLAKLYAYAVRADSLLDATGNYDSLRIGGSVFADSVDTQPPVISLSVVGGVVSGDITQVAGPDVTVRIGLSDNRGINIARSGLGHELTARLGNQTSVVLNGFYVASGLDSRQGEVVYTFNNVMPGRYSVQVKAWDINNNSTEGALSIVVSEPPGLSLRAFGANPNPVLNQTTLTANLNRAGDPLDWTVGVYDLTGRLLNQQAGQCTDCPGTLAVGTWDGRTTSGVPLANGLYVIRLQIRSGTDGSVATGSNRIVLSK